MTNEITLIAAASGASTSMSAASLAARNEGAEPLHLTIDMSNEDVRSRMLRGYHWRVDEVHRATLAVTLLPPSNEDAESARVDAHNAERLRWHEEHTAAAYAHLRTVSRLLGQERAWSWVNAGADPCGWTYASARDHLESHYDADQRAAIAIVAWCDGFLAEMERCQHLHVETLAAEPREG